VHIQLLGPVTARVEDAAIRLGRRQERALLGILALQPRRFVSLETLTDYLWENRPPEQARIGIRAMVSHLRAALRVAGERAPSLVARPGGYVLEIDPDRVDVHRFRSLVAATAGAPAAERVDLLARALDLWRGEPLADVLDKVARTRLCGDLEDLALAAQEDLLAARLDLGLHAEVAATAGALTRAYPLRERPVELLMRALYRDGRIGEALDAYGALAADLSRDLGLDPTPALAELRLAILRNDPVLGAERAHDPVLGAERTARESATGPGAPAQLPPAAHPFIGRDADLAALDAALNRPSGSRLALITGPAGVGKTALAVTWAAGEQNRFPDGQLYLDLQGFSRADPVTPLDALAELLAALGMAPAQIPGQLRTAVTTYRSLVAGRRILIVLDNALDAEQVRPLLPATAGPAVVVTSRDRLSGLVAVQGAARVEVTMMTPDSSAALLRALIPMPALTADPTVVDDLAAACDHLPLALRILGARITEAALVPIRDHLDELRRARLAALSLVDDDEAAVPAALGLSYTRLPEPTRALFRALGQLPGLAVGVEAAATIVDRDPGVVVRLLDRLTEAHLAVIHNGRYRMHDLVRAYAAERGAAEDGPRRRSDALARLFDWYLARAAGAAALLHPGSLRLEPDFPPVAFTDRAAASQWLDAERGTIIRLAALGRDGRTARAAALLVEQMRAHLWVRRNAVEWRSAALTGLHAAGVGGDPALRAAAHLSLGQWSISTGAYRHAHAHLRRASRLFRRAGRRDGVASVQTAFGGLGRQTGALASAARHLEYAARLNPASATTFSQLGNVYALTGRLVLARDQHAAALALHEAAGALPGQAVALNNLGATCLQLAAFTDAEKHLRRAIAVADEIGMRNAEAFALASLTEVLAQTGRTGEAVEVARRARDLAQQTGDPFNEACAVQAAGYAHRAAGELDAATDAYERAVELGRRIGAAELEAQGLTGLALARTMVGDDARTQARAALALADRHGLALLRTDALGALAAAEQAHGDTGTARELAERALASADAMDYALGRLRILESLSYRTA
jgi:DNA-binding SARP family transcriptional activator/tetratricopeptide (TPR) repeat protein